MPHSEPPGTGAAALPDVSVIIPVHGDRGALLRTLDCLQAQRTDHRFEVIVVDNGNNGDLPAQLAQRPVQVLREPHPGSYAARNTGMEAAAGAVLAFTDADCLPRPGWLQAGVQALAQAGPGTFVGGRIAMAPADPRRLSLAEVWQVGHDLRQDRYVAEEGWAATANLFVRAVDMHRVGLFDAGLKSGGDKNWGLRATAAGVRGVYCAAAAIEHPTRPTMAELMVKRRRVSKGSVDLARALGTPVHAMGTVRAMRPPLRATWRDGERLALSGVDRARLVAVTAVLHVYQRGYETGLNARTRGP